MIDTLTLGQALTVALATGIAAGLVAWGGMHVELRWLWSEVRRAHARIDRISDRLWKGQHGNPGDETEAQV